ncbi:MAG: heat-inducible transcriptional repressor HrcA [bacterium]|jgi:heat-inducible transcriptional repressor|nr:heat-inducible transcriptional repressor HrcA [bacterium]
MKSTTAIPAKHVPGLTDREAEVLRYVIHNFVMTANPVGSRTLSKIQSLDLGAATIRNAMADLEEKGLLAHPHTSAGRVPTDHGYRVYVNHLMEQERISREECQLIQQNVDELMPDVEAILERTAQLLSRIGRNLGIVLAPAFEEGVLERLDLVPLGGSRVLVVITVASGLARTVTLEIESRVDGADLLPLARMLQQRLAGLTLRQIRDTIADRLADVREGAGVARLFIDSADRLFAPSASQGVIMDGARNIPDIPEFREDGFRSILEIYEDRDIILHLLTSKIGEDISVLIGREHAEERAADYSLITASYHVGSLPGALGIIGPRRMNYSRLMHLVKYTADLISSRFAQDRDKDTARIG